MQFTLQWIFHRDGTIESRDINGNKCLLYKQRTQHIASGFLWLNIFFFQMNIQS